MKTHRTTVTELKGRAAAQPARAATQALLDQYECGSVALCGTPDASYEGHLTFDHVVHPEKSDPRERFEAVAWALLDLLSQRWLRTDGVSDQANSKQLTVGTRDGATIEIAEAAGEENFFLFGLSAEQVRDSRGSYNPHWHYDNEPDRRRALDLIRSGAFDRGEPGVFNPICDALLAHGDCYIHLADLSTCLTTQEQVDRLYGQPDAWTRRAIINVAHSGRLSSDRTTQEYARDIWGAEPCPIDQP